MRSTTSLRLAPRISSRVSLQRLRRLAGKGEGRLEDFVLEPLFLDEPADEAGIASGLGGKGGTGGKQRKGTLVAHDARCKETGAGLRHERQVDERRAELGSRRGEGQVAMELHRRADADRQPVDARDHRLAGAGKGAQETEHLARQGAVPGVGREVLHVVAGRKDTGAPEEHVRADGRVVVALSEGLRHRGIHAAAEGILLLRPVEPDHLHRAVQPAGPLDQNCVDH